MPGETRLVPEIWEDLEGYGPHERLLYAVLLTEKYRKWSGDMPLRVPTWARNCGLTVEETEKALEGLAGGDPFAAKVVIDRRTDELLVRTYIRWDGVADQPNVLKGALRESLSIRSPLLRRVLAAELWKLPARQPDKVGKGGRTFVFPDPHETARILDPESGPGPGKPSDEPFPNPSRTLPEPFGPNPSAGTLQLEPPGEGEGEVVNSPMHSQEKTSFVGDRFTTSDAATVARLDVEHLCDRLAARIAANTGRRPTITAKWRTECRLLLDRDLRHEPDARRLVEAVLDWATNDPFWSSNILSMPKLREKFDQLRLKRREQAGAGAVSTGRRRTTDDKRRDGRKIAAELFGDPTLDPDHAAGSYPQAIGDHR